MSKLALAGLVVLTAAAEDARQIIEEAQRRARASSQRYEGVLRVIDKNGKTTEKRWRYDRKGSHGDSKVILWFTEPAEVKGVALLVVNHPDRASDQWMWIPSLSRERRVAVQDRSSRFFGTDFSFEDLEERDAGQFDYRLMGEETADGAACFRIEGRPKEAKSSQYSRSTLWIREDNYVFVRIENFRRDQMVRRLMYSEIEQIQGIWTPRVLEMTDLTRNSRTVMRSDKIEYNVPVKDEDFTLAALRRGS